MRKVNFVLIAKKRQLKTAGGRRRAWETIIPIKTTILELYLIHGLWILLKERHEVIKSSKGLGRTHWYMKYNTYLPYVITYMLNYIIYIHICKGMPMASYVYFSKVPDNFLQDSLEQDGRIWHEWQRMDRWVE